MQISRCSIRIRFLSKTFKIFLYKFQDMYNNFKYGFHDKLFVPQYFIKIKQIFKKNILYSI